jgi:hypothetical protein
MILFMLFAGEVVERSGIVEFVPGNRFTRLIYSTLF